MRNNFLSPVILALSLFLNPDFPARTFDSPRLLTEVCTLPAPANLGATASGTTWVSLAWSTVENAAAYRVRVYRLPGAEMVADFQSSQPATTVNNLDPGVRYRFAVAAVCQNQIISDGIVAANEGTIVIDIVLNYTAPEGSHQLLQPDSIGCLNIDWTGPPVNILLDVVGQNEINRFNLEIADSAHVVIRKLAQIASSQNIQVVSQNFTPAPVYNIHYANIISDDTTIAISTINISRSGSKFTICVPPVAGYEFQFRQVVPAFSKAGEGERSISRPDQNPTAFKADLVQNPFTAVLRLSISAPEHSRLHIRVFDAGGHLVLERLQQIGAETTLQLPAEQLKPGIYFVHVETVDGIRILRAVKM